MRCISPLPDRQSLALLVRDMNRAATDTPIRTGCMEHYLVELDEHQLELLTAMVRKAMASAEEKEVGGFEALLSALSHIRWKAGDRSTD